MHFRLITLHGLWMKGRNIKWHRVQTNALRLQVWAFVNWSYEKFMINCSVIESESNTYAFDILKFFFEILSYQIKYLH